MHKSSVIFLVAIALLTIVGYYGFDLFNKKAELPIYGKEGHKVENFTFLNQNGELFNSTDFDGKIWVVNYFFTSCPSICPKMMRNMQLVHNVVRDDEGVGLLSLTVDPKRDTPERLMGYLENFNVNDDSWQLLTGEKKELYRIARKSFLIAATDGGDGGDTDFIHSENIVVVDENKQIRAIINGTAADAADQILNVVSQLKLEK